MNLVNLVKDQLGGSVVNQLGGLLGESGANTERAVSGAVPAILGGLMNSSGAGDGASRLNAALDDHDDSILDNIGGLLGGGNHSQVANQGSSMLGNLLGGNALGSIAGALSGFSGLGRGSSGSLIGMLAPIVMSVLRRQRNSQGLDAGGLASMLSGQRDNIAAAMPAGFDTHLQKEGLGDSLLGGLRGGASTVSSAVSGGTDRVASSVSSGVSSVGAGTAAAGAAAVGAGAAATRGGGGILKKLIPLLILLGILWLLWKFFLGGGAGDVMDKAKDAGNAAVETTKSVGETATGAVKSVGETATGGVSGAVSGVSGAVSGLTGGGDMVGELGGMFDSATQSIGGITDAASAEAAVPAIEGMTDKLGGLSGAFGSLPDAAKGPIQSLVGDKMPMLQGALDKAMQIPGVEGVLGPVAGGLMEKLSGFGG